MAYITQDIKKGEIMSAICCAQFDKGKETLERHGYSIISLEENALLRIQEGPTSQVSMYGNWVKGSIIYVPKEGAFLTKESPMMENPEEAMQANRELSEFYSTKEQIDKSLEDSVKLSKTQIPTDRFGDDEITVYAFGNIAKEYGNFLENNGINEMPIWLIANPNYVNSQEKRFVRQLWFGELSGGSKLDGPNKYLLCDFIFRGVRKIK